MTFDEVLARPEFERLRDWASIGPVQKVALEEFVEHMTYEAQQGAYAAGFDEGYVEAKTNYEREEFDK